MGTFVKLFFGLIIIAVIGGFVINHMPEFKQKFIEVINPAAKEGRLLGTLDQNLNELGDVINAINSGSDEDQATAVAKSKDLIEKTKTLLGEVRDINDKNSGVVKQQVAKIIDSLFDRTPFPADHLQVSDTETSHLVCPPIE